MGSEEAGGKEEDQLVSLWNKDANSLVQLLPRPGSGFGELLVCSSLGKSYLSLHGQVKTLAGIINDFFLSVNEGLKLKIFHYFLVRSQEK